ncbi:hypothetical protein CK203_026422 [Vitis vinifera]|uniref:Integrase zinc-binding domain-containing protein n=1 Tax=Vitis vinifera TaxID=29760 RepID=A0A438IVZ8_VITVI|nr:hypothetical protein CK203_026422 [Vitis vinifera]
MCHEGACGGHFAPRKTLAKILQSGFYWPTMFKDCNTDCKSCPQCQQLGKINTRPRLRESFVQAMARQVEDQSHEESELWSTSKPLAKLGKSQTPSEDDFSENEWLSFTFLGVMEARQRTQMQRWEFSLL